MGFRSTALQSRVRLWALGSVASLLALGLGASVCGTPPRGVDYQGKRLPRMVTRAIGLDIGIDAGWVDAPTSIAIPGIHVGLHYGGGH